MTSSRIAPSLRPAHALRLLLATLVVAAAGSLSQTAWAAPHEGPGGHRGMDRPHHMERMLNAVNATPEQRAQVKQIMQAAHAESAAQHAATRALHEQSQALFAQPTVDARAAEAVRQQMMALHDQASKRRMQALLEVSRVLTPEQRKTLSETMGKRRAMMERHRAERQTIEAAPR